MASISEERNVRLVMEYRATSKAVKPKVKSLERSGPRGPGQQSHRSLERGFGRSWARAVDQRSNWTNLSSIVRDVAYQVVAGVYTILER